ncbi:MAG: hypothetical protein JXR80_05235 [Deltaproteobacteria bacterium]|nr:hypothetical protein [Deltaproteobacteria bacterium]
MMLISSCAAKRDFFLDENVEINLLRRIAVLPFANHTQTKFVESRLRDVITTEILSRGIFDIVADGDIRRFLKSEVSGNPEAVDTAVARKMGRELEVEAFMTGAVDIYDENRNGSYTYPVVAVTLCLLDVRNNKIIWQASASESGYGTWSRVFGFASDDFNQVSFRLAQKVLASLIQE